MGASLEKHVDDFDHLRGVAILLTLIAHLMFMQETHSGALAYINNNIAQFWGGVLLFFVISGYVITRGFMTGFGLLASPRRSDFLAAWKAFYVRRFFRIVPTAMLWILLTFSCAVTLNFHGSFGTMQSNVQQALAASLFVYNFFVPSIAGASFGVYWSLSLEEQFYLVFPVLMRRSESLKYAIVVLVIIAFLFIHRPANQALIMVSFPVDALCYGVLIAMLERGRWLRRWEPRFLKSLSMRYANQAAAVAMLIFFPIIFRSVTPGTSFLVLVAAWMVFCASFDKGYMRPIGMIRKVTRLLGRVSFSLYCSHMLAFLLTREVAITFRELFKIESGLQNFLALLVATLLCASFTYFSVTYVERPTRLLGRRLELAMRSKAGA